MSIVSLQQVFFMITLRVLYCYYSVNDAERKDLSGTSSGESQWLERTVFVMKFTNLCN